MGRGAWQATVHGVTESNMTEQPTHTHKVIKVICLLLKENIYYIYSNFNYSSYLNQMVTAAMKLKDTYSLEGKL